MSAAVIHNDLEKQEVTWTEHAFDDPSIALGDAPIDASIEKHAEM